MGVEGPASQVLQLINPAFAAAVSGSGGGGGGGVGVERGSVALQTAAAGALASLAAAAPERVVPGLLALVVPALEDSGEAAVYSHHRNYRKSIKGALTRLVLKPVHHHRR